MQNNNKTITKYDSIPNIQKIDIVLKITYSYAKINADNISDIDYKNINSTALDSVQRR